MQSVNEGFLQQMCPHQPGCPAHTRLSGVMRAWSRSYVLLVKPGSSANTHAGDKGPVCRAILSAVLLRADLRSRCRYHGPG